MTVTTPCCNYPPAEVYYFAVFEVDVFYDEIHNATTPQFSYRAEEVTNSEQAKYTTEYVTEGNTLESILVDDVLTHLGGGAPYWREMAKSDFPMDVFSIDLPLTPSRFEVIVDGQERVVFNISVDGKVLYALNKTESMIDTTKVRMTYHLISHSVSFQPASAESVLLYVQLPKNVIPTSAAIWAQELVSASMYLADDLPSDMTSISALPAGGIASKKWKVVVSDMYWTGTGAHYLRITKICLNVSGTSTSPVTITSTLTPTNGAVTQYCNKASIDSDQIQIYADASTAKWDFVYTFSEAVTPDEINVGGNSRSGDYSDLSYQNGIPKYFSLQMGRLR
jgi:hypothetical protein